MSTENNALSATQVRARRLLDERETTRRLCEDLISHVEARTDDPEPNEAEHSQIAGYRQRIKDIDQELVDINDVLAREEESAKVSKLVRAHLSGRAADVEIENGQTKYRTFAAYARDEIISRFPSVAALAGGEREVQFAKERLMRAPVHTLSGDVGGLIPAAHIAQIMDIINTSRPVIQSGQSVALERGSFTYPKITARPEVLLQGTEKTEGGTAKMTVEMETATGQTFIGGGNLSWQAINWSTPDALALWFQLAGEAYAQKTEGTACAVLTAAGTAVSPGTVAGTTADTFDDWLTAVVAGAGEVYTNSQALANTLYLSPDMFFLAAGLTSDSGAMLINAGQLNIGTLTGTLAGLRVITSPGFSARTAIVGDSSALLVGETAGAPVELRAVEPAIGGLEVGVIGALAAVAFDDLRFAKLTSA